MKKLGIRGEAGERVTIFDEHGFFAIGEITEEGGEAYLKPTKQFDV